MKTYLVGGAVRDKLLNRPVHERDWVVVGSSIDEMIDQGFMPVGKAFPVFLHPQTKEEYALARTEKKVSKGYKGFTFYTDPDVTLEQDLARRDLTINAIAQDDDGTLVDPYNGIDDIKDKTLRHVSNAFSEDPVRILRLARFAAKLPEFNVCDKTTKLMQSMCAAGEVDALVAERVWAELFKALNEDTPWRFFEIVDSANALTILFPEITLNDAGIQALKRICKNTDSVLLRFSSLFINKDEYQTRAFCKRLKPPKEFIDLAVLMSKFQTDFNNSIHLNSDELITLLTRVDAFRRKQRFLDWLFVLRQCCDNGEKNAAFLEKCFNAAKNVDYQNLIEQGLDGKEFAEALFELRRKAID